MVIDGMDDSRGNNTAGGPLDLPTEEITPGTACVWWEYLQVAIGSEDGIYYQLDGAVGSRSLSVEYLLSDVRGAPYQVIAVIQEQNPGKIDYFYFSEGDGGVNATIGVQGLGANNGEFVEGRRKLDRANKDRRIERFSVVQEHHQRSMYGVCNDPRRG